MSAPLVAPFPYFGGKRTAAAMVWERLGDPANYVEPFFGSGAVALGRPTAAKTETLNDIDGLLVNFWRAVQTDPERVAQAADWPVSEIDLHARHAYLVKRIPWLVDRLMGDPAFCDPKLAGWWAWGACSWIGSGWCSGNGPWVESGGMLIRREELPHVGDHGRGVNKQLPHVGDPGRGVNKKLPHAEATPGARFAFILDWMQRLQIRLRDARITCGSWERVLTPVVTTRHGLTAVFLDPPYGEGEMQYNHDAAGLAAEVGAWCRENGSDQLLRIALCGYECGHDLPGWDAVPWKARGGYGNAGGEDADDNRHRETIWFSPHCLQPTQGRLFAVASAAEASA